MVTPWSFQAALVVGSPCRISLQESLRGLITSSLPEVFRVPTAITFDLVDAFKAEPTLPLEAQEASPKSGRMGS